MREPPNKGMEQTSGAPADGRRRSLLIPGVSRKNQEARCST